MSAIEEQSFPEKLRKEFGDQTVKQAYDTLNTMYGNSQLTWDEYVDHANSLMGVPSDTLIPAWEVPDQDEETTVLPVPERPKIHKLSAGAFVRDYSGDSVKVGQVHAQCETLLWLDSNGEIVFEDVENQTYCVLRIDRLMDAIKSRRARFETERANYIEAGGSRFEPRLFEEE